MTSLSPKTRTGETSMTVPAGIGREAKTPRPGTVNHGKVRTEEKCKGYITWHKPLTVLETRTSPSVLSRGVPWSSDTCSCCIGLRQQKVMNDPSRVLSDVVVGLIFPSPRTCKTLEGKRYVLFVDLDFHHRQRSGCGPGRSSTAPVVHSSQWQIFP